MTGQLGQVVATAALRTGCEQCSHPLGRGANTRLRLTPASWTQPGWSRTPAALLYRRDCKPNLLSIAVVKSCECNRVLREPARITKLI